MSGDSNLVIQHPIFKHTFIFLFANIVTSAILNTPDSHHFLIYFYDAICHIIYIDELFKNKIK